VRELIDWANNNKLSVISPIPEVKTYQELFYPPYEKKVYLTTIYDERVRKKYHEMINKNYNFNKLYIKYWLDLIKKYQDKVRENSLVEFVNVG
jgi:hypothetical protein